MTSKQKELLLRAEDIIDCVLEQSEVPLELQLLINKYEQVRLEVEMLEEAELAETSSKPKKRLAITVRKR